MPRTRFGVKLCVITPAAGVVGRNTSGSPAGTLRCQRCPRGACSGGQNGGPRTPLPKQRSMPLRLMLHRPDFGGSAVRRRQVLRHRLCGTNVDVWYCSADIAMPRLRRMGCRLRSWLYNELQHWVRRRRRFGIALRDRRQLAVESAPAPVKCNSRAQHLPTQSSILISAHA